MFSATHLLRVGAQRAASATPAQLQAASGAAWALQLARTPAAIGLRPLCNSAQWGAVGLCRPVVGLRQQPSSPGAHFSTAPAEKVAEEEPAAAVNEPAAANDAAETPTDTDGPDLSEDGPAAEIAAVKAELEASQAVIAELEGKVKDFNDQLLRSLAEQENTRTIARRDVDNARKFGVQKFGLEMLDMADNLARAAEAVPEEYREENPDDGSNPIAKNLASLYRGVGVTDKALHSSLARFGITKLDDPIGQKVDLNLHDVKFAMPATETTESGTVGAVIRTGYMMEERVMRAAEVGVVS